MKPTFSVIGVVVVVVLATGLLASSVAADSVATGECAKIFEAGIREGVIHGAAVVSGGLDGETLSGAWGWADAARTRRRSFRADSSSVWRSRVRS